MKNLLDPRFIESALSDFQVISKHLSGDVFDRADEIRGDTNAHMVQLNKAYASGDRAILCTISSHTKARGKA